MGKKLMAVVMLMVLIVIGTMCVWAAGDTGNVAGEAKLYAQYRTENDGTYTVRFIADTAYDPETSDYAEVGFFCTNSNPLFGGDYYWGTKVYKSIVANGETKTAEGYYVVFEITGVEAGANLQVQPMAKKSNDDFVYLSEAVVEISMSDIINNAGSEEQEEESTTTGGNTGEEPETEIVDGYSLKFEYYKDTKTCAIVKGSYASGTVTLPETSVNPEDGQSYTVASIDYEAFLDSRNLVSITIPSTITIIGDNAFMNCYALSEVNLSSGVTGLGTKAFYCCSSLPEITLPSSITTLGTDVFGACTSLKTVYAIGNVATLATQVKAQDNIYDVVAPQ